MATVARIKLREEGVCFLTAVLIIDLANIFKQLLSPLNFEDFL
jgi:hypothetical protein